MTAAAGLSIENVGGVQFPVIFGRRLVIVRSVEQIAVDQGLASFVLPENDLFGVKSELKMFD